LRNDIERLITDEDAKTIKDVLKKQCTCVTPITTTSNFRLNQIDETNREMILMDKFAEFGSKELIVTDRLHAMIFSVFTQTPCIVFDNTNKKISETYRWLKNNPSIKLINNVKELPQAIDEVIGVRISFSIDDYLRTTYKCNKTMETIKIFFECLIPETVCNLKCGYCYVVQRNQKTNKIPQLDFPISTIKKALTKERLGGTCYFSICGAGETFAPDYLIDIVRVLLENGHM
jgi:hypothetical protein